MAESQGNGHGIVINFSANVRDVIEGTKDIEVSATEMYQAFKDGADESVTTFEEMTEAQQKEFRDQFENAEDLQRGITKLAQEELEAKRVAAAKYEEYAEQTFRKVGRDAEASADEIADNTEEGFDKATSNAKQAGQEIGDGLKDVISDFDGSVESMGAGVASTLGGISAIIPGIGGFVGAALASIAGGMFDSWNENADKTEQRVADMYDDLLASGQNFRTQEQISAAIDAITGDPDKQREAVELANDLGLAVSDVTLAMATDGPQREALLKRTNELLAEAGDNAENSTGRLQQSFQLREVQLEKYVSKVEGWSTAEGTALYWAQINRRAQEDLGVSLSETADAVDSVTKSVERLPDSKSVKVDADVSGVEAALRRIPKILPLEARVFTRDGKRVY